MGLHLRSTCGSVRTGMFLLAAMVPFTSQAQPLPPVLKRVLKSNLHFPAQEVQQAETGQGVVRLVDTNNPEDVFVTGIIRLGVPPAYFVERSDHEPDCKLDERVSLEPQDKAGAIGDGHVTAPHPCIRA